MSALGMVVISPDSLLLRLIHDHNDWDLVFFRSGFLALAFALFLLIRYRRGLAAHLASLGPYALLSGIVLSSSNFFFVNAITHTSVANTLAILAAMPLFSAALGRVLIGERVRPRTIATIVVAVGGIAAIFVGSLATGTWLGDLFAFGAAFVQGLNLVIMRRAGNADRLPSLCLAGIISSVGALLIGAHPAGVGAHDLAILALAGLLMLPLAMALFMSGTRFVPAAEVALLALVETVLGPLWAWIGVGEVPTLVSVIGGLVVVLAVAANALLRREGR